MYKCFISTVIKLACLEFHMLFNKIPQHQRFHKYVVNHSTARSALQYCPFSCVLCVFHTWGVDMACLRPLVTRLANKQICAHWHYSVCHICVKLNVHWHFHTFYNDERAKIYMQSYENEGDSKITNETWVNDFFWCATAFFTE